VPISFTSGNLLTFPLPGLSLRWYESLASGSSWIDAARNSLVVGLSATALSVLLGTLGALGLARARFKLKPGQQVKVALVATPGDPITPKLIQQQRRPPRIDVNIEMDGIVVGGMTFPIDPKWKA